MKEYSKRIGHEFVEDVSEPVYLLHSGPYQYLGSKCYTGGGTMQQDSNELGNPNLRLQVDFLHDCKDITPHGNSYQSIIVTFMSPVDPRVKDFALDSSTNGYAYGGMSDDRYQIRFDTKYNANPYNESLGIGDICFHIVPWTAGDSDEIADIGRDLVDNILEIEAWCPNYTG